MLLNTRKLLRRTSVIAAVSLSLLAAVLYGDSPPEPIGKRFHRLTSFDHSGYVQENPHWGPQIPLYKSYPEAPRLSLELGPEDHGDAPRVLTGLLNERRSIRSYREASLTLDQLSRVLLAANGLTRSVDGSARRTTPSAGALYPMEVYVVINEVGDLQAGLYHFNPEDSTLSRLKSGDLSHELSMAGNNQPWVGPAPATLLLAARFPRVTAKYADRGYRYAYIECGAVCQNVYLQATALNLGTVAVGAVNDQALNEMLGVDGVREAGLLIMPLGIPN